MSDFKPTMSHPDIKILVVDDSQFARELVHNFLKEAGFENLMEADTPEDAISMVLKRKPNLVLLDIDLGGHFDGVEVLKEIKKKRPETKVIMVSALGQKLIEEEVIAENADAFLLKPYKRQQLLFAIGLAMGYSI